MSWGDNWDKDEIERLKKLCEKGDILSFDDIANKLNRTVGSVRGACHRFKIQKKTLNGYSNLYLTKRSLPKYIKYLMKKKEISINKLSYNSGVSVEEILKILNLENKKPDKKVLKKLNEVLDGNYEHLLIISGHKENEKVHQKRFKSPTKWEIKNVLLMGLLFSYDIKISELADAIDVTERTVQRWIYEGLKPNLENQKKVSDILKINKNILFGEISQKKEINL